MSQVFSMSPQLPSGGSAFQESDGGMFPPVEVSPGLPLRSLIFNGYVIESWKK
jgi:hypothetical protein